MNHPGGDEVVRSCGSEEASRPQALTTPLHYPTTPPPSGSDDPRVIEALEEYTAAVREGRKPSREEFQVRYPEIADALSECLEGLEFIQDAAPRLHESAEEFPARAPGSAEDIQPLGSLGDFRILREIGRGGMGIVYEAEQISLGRRVALKVLPFAGALDPKQLQRFKNEAQAAAHLQHTNIVPVHYVGCERGVHFYAMQYIDGQTIAAVIRELRANDEFRMTNHQRMPNSQCQSTKGEGVEADLPSKIRHSTLGVLSSLGIRHSSFFRTVARLGVQAAEALEHAHQLGIIHRDIKPANLLVDGGGRLWVTDFGLAHCQSQPGLTMTGDLLGTLRYMSPEQALAKRVTVDARTDVYSLGVTLYELLTLEPAYNGRTREQVLRQIAFEEPRLPGRLNKAVPAELETIVTKAMAKNPEERYATAQQLAEDMRRYLEDKPIKAKRPSLRQRAAKWARRHKTVVRAALVVLVLAIVALAVSTWLILAAYRMEAKERQGAVAALYHSYVREAETIRQARAGGYRSKAWQHLQAALKLETPEKDPNELRQQAVACMGDFVGLEPTIWRDFSADITAIALHPNGEQLAIGLNDGTVLLRDLGTGEVSGHLKGHPARVTALAFAPDGVRLVSGDCLGTLRLWTANADGRWAQTRTFFPGHGLVRLLPGPAFLSLVPQFDDPTLEGIAVSPDGKQVAACIGGVFSDMAPAITLWNLSDGSRTATLFREPRLEKYCRLAFSPDGKLLASSYSRRRADGLSVDFGVMLWSLDKGEVSQDLPSDLWRVHEVVFSPDGKLLACGCEEGVALYEAPKFQRRLFRVGDFVFWGSIAFSSDSQLLALANRQLGVVRLWNVAANHELAVLQMPGNLGHLVAFRNDRLVAASHAAVRAWNLANGNETLVLARHGKGIPGIAFSPDGKLLVSAGKDRTVKIWNPTTGELLKELTDFRNVVQTVTFSPGGQILAVGDWAGDIQFWDVASWTKLTTLTIYSEIGRYTRSIAFSPNGRYFAAGAGEVGGVMLWRIQPGITPQGEAKAGLRMQRVPGPTRRSYVCTLAFNPDSDILAWMDEDEIHLWDLAKAQEHPFPPDPFPPVRLYSSLYCLAFHPATKHLMFVAATGVPEAWDITTGQKVGSFGADDIERSDGTMPSLNSVIALNSEGDRLATCRGRFVDVWDTADRKLLLKLPMEQGGIWSLAWSPNGKLLAIGSSDGGLVIWNIPKIKEQLEAIGLGW